MDPEQSCLSVGTVVAAHLPEDVDYILALLVLGRQLQAPSHPQSDVFKLDDRVLLVFTLRLCFPAG